MIDLAANDPYGADDFRMEGDYVGGCLPRATDPGSFFPLVPEAVPGAEVDAIQLVPESEYATQETRRTYQTRTIDQNGYPACCLAALSNAMELLMAIQGRTVTPLDWHKAWKTLSGGRGGVALDTAAEYAATHGIPRADGKGVVKIAEAYDCDTPQALASASMRGCVGVFAHDVHAECWTRIVVDGRKVLLDTVNSWGRWGEVGPGGFYGWHLFALSEAEINRYGVIAIRALGGDGLELGRDAA